MLSARIRRCVQATAGMCASWRAHLPVNELLTHPENLPFPDVPFYAPSTSSQDAAGHPLLLVIGRYSGGPHPYNPQTLLLNLSSNTWHR